MEKFTVLLDKKRKYKGSLPCPVCGRSLLHNAIKNGVKYVQGREGKPEKIWNADLYKCECGHLVLTDFGRVSQWNRKNTPNLQAVINDWQQHNAHADSMGAEIMITYSWQFIEGAASDVLSARMLAYIEAREQGIRKIENALSSIRTGRAAA